MSCKPSGSEPPPLCSSRSSHSPCSFVQPEVSLTLAQPWSATLSAEAANASCQSPPSETAKNSP